jgi:predicted PurR-regulated permease PerM
MMSKTRILIRRSAGLLGLALLLFALWRFRTLVGYLLISVALSFVGRPIVKGLNKIKIGGRPIPTGIGAAVALLAFGTSIVLFAQLFAPLAIDQANAIRQINPDDLSSALSALTSWLDDDLGGLDLSGEGIPNSEFLLSQAQGLVQVQGVGSLFGGLIGLIGNLLIATFSILFMTFFFLKDSVLYRRIIFTLTPDSQEKRVDAILKRTTELLTRYFGGLVIQVLIITTIVSLGTALAGAEHAFLIGLMAGVFNLIPYIGPMAGAVIGLLLIATTHGGPVQELPAIVGGSLVAFLVAQLVDNFFTQPFVFSSRVNAHPLEIFLVISIAGSTAGPAGMVLAIPAYTLFRIVASETLGGFKVIDRLTASVKAKPEQNI